MIRIAAEAPIIPIAKTQATTTPEVVRWLSLSMQIGLPARSVWQSTPGAQLAEGVIVGVQEKVEPWLTEQYDVVTMFVTKQAIDVVLEPVVVAVVVGLVVDVWELEVVDGTVVEDGGEAEEVVFASVVVVFGSTVEVGVVEVAAACCDDDCAAGGEVVAAAALDVAAAGSVVLLASVVVFLSALFIKSACTTASPSSWQCCANQAAPTAASDSSHPPAM